MKNDKGIVGPKAKKHDFYYVGSMAGWTEEKLENPAKIGMVGRSASSNTLSTYYFNYSSEK